MNNVISQQSPDNHPERIRTSDCLLSIKETAASLGYSTRTIWRMIDRRVLPEPSVHPGGRKKYFLRSVIDAYIRRLNGGLTA